LVPVGCLPYLYSMRFVLFMFILNLLFPASAQVFTQYTPDNSDVPDLLVHALHKGPDGSIWICTESGLVKHDTGGIWTLFNTSNSGLPDNSVRSVYAESDGVVWVGTFLGGLARYDGADWTVYNSSNSGLPENFIRCINRDLSDTMWIGTNAGLARWDGADEWTTFTIDNSGLLSNNIVDIYVDENNDLYLGTLNGGLSTYIDGVIDYYRTENSFIADNTVMAVAEDAFANKWMATAFGGLSIFTEAGDFLNFNPFNSDIPDLEVNDVALDNEGLGILTMAATGLVQFDGSNWVIWDTENSAIPTNYLNSVVVDDANRIWIATEDAGLLVLERNAVGVDVLSSAENTEIYPNPAHDIVFLHTADGASLNWQLYNNAGMLCRSGMTRQNTTQILLNDLPAGLYHIRVFHQGQPAGTSYLIIE